MAGVAGQMLMTFVLSQTFQNQLCAERFGVNLAPGFICLWPCCSFELLQICSCQGMHACLDAGTSG